MPGVLCLYGRSSQGGNGRRGVPLRGGGVRAGMSPTARCNEYDVAAVSVLARGLFFAGGETLRAIALRVMGTLRLPEPLDAPPARAAARVYRPGPPNIVYGACLRHRAGLYLVAPSKPS
jgi:hypothetical protein